MTKRLLCVCLALVLLFGVLAGCSKNEAQTADDTKKTEQSDTEDKTSTQFAYQAQYFDLPEDIQWIGTSCVTGDTLYFTASVPDGGKETYTDENGEEIQMTESVDEVNVEDMSGLMEGDRFELEEESFEDAGFREAELSEIDDDSNIGISEDE